MHRSHVEEDARLEDRVGHGLGEPGRELLPPVLQAQPPARVGRHDVPGAGRIAALDEPGTHPPRELLEPGEVGVGRLVADDDRVVLVRGESLLEARPGAQGHPGVGHRRPAQLGLGERDESPLDRVTDRGDDPADVVGAGVLPDEGLDDGGQAGTHGGDALDVGLLLDVADDVDGAGLDHPHEVGGRHDADRPVVLEDWQVVDVAPHHLEEDLEGEGVGVAHERPCRHHLLDRTVGTESDREHSIAQVTVGDDPGERLAVHDEQRGGTVFLHRARGLGDRCALRDRDRCPRDEVAHAGPEHGGSGVLQGGHGPTHPVRALLVEEVGEVRVGAGQRMEVGTGKHIDERVLDRGDLEGRGVAEHQGDRPEDVPGLGSVDEHALVVTDVDGTRAQDVKAVVVLAAGDDRPPAAVVLDGQPARQVGEYAAGQGVEGRMLGEEVADLCQLDVEGHGLCLPAAGARRARLGPPRAERFPHRAERAWWAVCRARQSVTTSPPAAVQAPMPPPRW